MLSKVISKSFANAVTFSLHRNTMLSFYDMAKAVGIKKIDLQDGLMLNYLQLEYNKQLRQEKY